MDPRTAAATDATRLFSTVVLSPDGEMGVEALVLPNIGGGVDELADVLRLELRESHGPTFTVEAVWSRFAILLEDVVAEDVDLLARRQFVDEIFFTRQIAMELSPLDRWSIAELWTKFSGAAGGVGIAHAGGGSLSVMIICGTFGSLIIRPLSAVSEGIAEGLKTPVREATERYARRWLGRIEHASAVRPERQRPTPRYQAADQPVDPHILELEREAMGVLARMAKSLETLELAEDAGPMGSEALYEALYRAHNEPRGFPPGLDWDTLLRKIETVTRDIQALPQDALTDDQGYALASVEEQLETLEIIHRRWLNWQR